MFLPDNNRLFDKAVIKNFGLTMKYVKITTREEHIKPHALYIEKI